MECVEKAKMYNENVLAAKLRKMICSEYEYNGSLTRFRTSYFVAVEGAVEAVLVLSGLLVLLSEDFVSELVLLSEVPSPDFVSLDFVSPLPEGAAAFFSA